MPEQGRRGPGWIDRRGFLRGVGAGAGLLAAPAFLPSLATGAERPSSLFTLGVASGDPGFHSVVLWTRLAPEPLTGGGLGSRPVPVTFEVATDPGMSRVIRRGVRLATADRGHTVHATVSGLPSNRWLFYRFHALGESSRIGRTRTFPTRLDPSGPMRFALVSCQDLRDGFYPAYADIATQELDFVLHVGDFIYEGGPAGQPIAPDRNHEGPELFSVDQYRSRYALYRLDSNLQDAMARLPFIVTPDDHEVDNNYAGAIAEEGAPFQGAEFLERRRNALRVYAETMPLRPANRVQRRDGTLSLFRRLRFGDLADLHVLETRQHRSDQPAGDGFGSVDPDSAALEPIFGEEIFDDEGILDPNATMLGREQELLLDLSLRTSRSRWNILAQQVMVTQWNLVEAARLTVALDPSIPDPLRATILAQVAAVDSLVGVDAWDGAPAARRRLFESIERARTSNPVVLTGDIHSGVSSNLLRDFSDPSSRIVAAEFVCTSITSTFGGLDPRPTHALVRASVEADNPHIAYFNGLFRGYCICDVDERRFQTTYRTVGSEANALDPSPLALVPQRGAALSTDAVLEIAAGFNDPRVNGRIESRMMRPLPI